MNPQTCGIYKNGSDRYLVDADGCRTDGVDKVCFEVEEKISV